MKLRLLVSVGALLVVGVGVAVAASKDSKIARASKYAGKFDNAKSSWADLPAANGLTGLQAGDAQCRAIGGDHVCNYEEIKAAAASGDSAFMSIPKGTTAWLHRTTAEKVNGKVSNPGPGGTCNDHTYITNHISDGEYVDFIAAGVPKYHLDNDTIYDPQAPGEHTLADALPCGGVTRSILCCSK